MNEAKRKYIDFQSLTEEQQNEVLMNIGKKLNNQEIWYWEGLVYMIREQRERIKETCRILNSAKGHYKDDKTNWAIERALRQLVGK